MHFSLDTVPLKSYMAGSLPKVMERGMRTGREKKACIIPLFLVWSSLQRSRSTMSTYFTIVKKVCILLSILDLVIPTKVTEYNEYLLYNCRESLHHPLFYWSGHPFKRHLKKALTLALSCRYLPGWPFAALPDPSCTQPIRNKSYQ